MKFICPLIVVQDIEKSRRFYEEILNQKVKLDFGENITFHGDFAIHQKDHFQNLINDSKVKQKSNNFELYFEDDNIEEIVSKLKELDIEFVHEIKEQPWKQKVVRFYDFDKNMIEIGESMEHVCYRLYYENFTLDEISKITYMSKKAVEVAIKKYST